MNLARGLQAIVMALLVTLLMGQYVDVKSQALAQQNLDIRLVIERFVRLNEHLTQLMALAAAERNMLRTATYATLALEAETIEQEVVRLTQNLAMASEVEILREEAKALRAAERRAIQLMEQEKWDDARLTLTGNEHMVALKIHQIDSDSVVGAVELELNRKVRETNQLRQLTLVARLLVIALLLWVGFQYSKRLRAELAEQTLLRLQLTSANEALELRVRERTEELEWANVKLAHLVETDALTGLASRQRFEQYWDEEWRRALRQGTALGVIMVDVDYFKNYNDSLGHPQGDLCLKVVGRILRSTTKRAGELAARYGGEEFVLVLPGVTQSAALETAHSVQAALEAEKLPHPASPVSEFVTVSMGLTVDVPKSEASRQDLIERADQMLYSAKREGRNRIAAS